LIFDIIRVEQIVSIILAVVGMYLALDYSHDNHQDLKAYALEGQNGRAKLAAVIGKRNGYAKAWLHAMIGISVIFVFFASPGPAPRLYGVAIGFYIFLILAQIVPVLMQILNQRDRRKLLLSYIGDDNAKGQHIRDGSE
jgi:hypothetical protein